MFPTAVEEEGMHTVDILAIREIEHPAPTGWISLFLQTTSGNEIHLCFAKLLPYHLHPVRVKSRKRPIEYLVREMQ